MAEPVTTTAVTLLLLLLLPWLPQPWLLLFYYHYHYYLHLLLLLNFRGTVLLHIITEYLLNNQLSLFVGYKHPFGLKNKSQLLFSGTVLETDTTYKICSLKYASLSSSVQQVWKAKENSRTWRILPLWLFFLYFRAIANVTYQCNIPPFVQTWLKKSC